MKITLLVPTIYTPIFLKDYQANVEQYEHELDYVVIGDLKTPPEAADFCQSIPNCTYLDPAAQNEYMKKFPKLNAHMPFNCAERLNVGMLWAYENGTDLFFMVNDDNFPSNCDMIRSHKKVGETLPLRTISSSSGWFNVCDFLEERDGTRFYHRGYPAKQRWNDGEIISQYERRKIILNEGLWLDNPDTDVIARMEKPLYTLGFKNNCVSEFSLLSGTWSPLNSQNTTIHRDAVPAYFQSPFIGRHSDIWAGYIIVRLAEAFDHAITFGEPLSIHQRSPHDLWKDLDNERMGLQLTDDFCDALRKIEIRSDNYHDGLAEIIIGLADWANTPFKTKFLQGLRIWHETFTEILRG